MNNMDLSLKNISHFLFFDRLINIEISVYEISR